MIEKNMGPAPAGESVEEPVAEGEEQPNVTPEEQQLYDMVVVTAQAYLYSPGATKLVAEKLKTQSQEATIEYAIGHTTAMILLSIKGARKKQEMEPIPADVMYGAGQEVLIEVMDIAAHAGLIEDAEDTEVFKRAAFEAAKVYGDSELKMGEVTPEVRAEAKDTLSRIRPGNGAGPQGMVGKTMATEEEQIDG